jgi:hypothetical protein
MGETVSGPLCDPQLMCGISDAEFGYDSEVVDSETSDSLGGLKDRAPIKGDGLGALVVEASFNHVVSRSHLEGPWVHAGTGRYDHSHINELILQNRIGCQCSGKDHAFYMIRVNAVEGLLERFSQRLQEVFRRGSLGCGNDFVLVQQHGVGLRSAHIQSEDHGVNRSHIIPCACRELGDSTYSRTVLRAIVDHLPIKRYCGTSG